jgi:adenylate cyclase
VSDALQAIGEGKLDTRLEVGSGDEFGRVEEAVNTMAKSLQQGSALKGALARYMSRDVAHDMVKLAREPEFVAGAERKRITVLFCDLDDFEMIDQLMPEERILEMLNGFFTRAIAAVFDSGGTIDRFSGAGLMATFGADGSRTDPEASALSAARTMVAAMRDTMIPLPEDVDLAVRIGIHTGEALVERTGEGSGGRMAFRAVGGAVDIAAIAMGRAAEVGEMIVITSATISALEDVQGKDVGEVGADGESVRLLAVS